MYWLIETKEQLKRLQESSYKEAFIEVIPFNFNEHPCETQVCAIYVRPIQATKGYLIAISHNEAFNIDINVVLDVITQFNTIYVKDKKEFLHYFIHKNIYDISLSSPYKLEVTVCHQWFYKNYPNKKDINRIIPIVKHYEVCEKIFNDLKPNINGETNKFFNNKASVVFNALERSGIRIDRQKFEENFYLSNSDYIFTQYNFKTLTRRPSNTFKGVNFAALNKKNNEREAFIPRNDIFMELDISAYHPTLLGKLIGYNFPTNDIHRYFAEMYGVSYSEAKEITFKQLYGGILDKYKELPFFKLVQEYKTKIWEEFQQKGYIECPISKYKIKSSYKFEDGIENITAHKLLNYLLQNLETSLNILIMWEIFKILRGAKTKLVLYTYDSFTLDVDKTEKPLIKEILKVFEKHNLSLKIKYGSNYDFKYGV